MGSVTKGDGIAALQMRALNRLESWRSGMAQPAKGFVSQPEPRTIGLFARGRQLIAGNVLLAGFLVEAKEASLWDVVAPDPAFEAAAQGFAGWMIWRRWGQVPHEPAHRNGHGVGWRATGVDMARAGRRI